MSPGYALDIYKHEADCALSLGIGIFGQSSSLPATPLWAALQSTSESRLKRPFAFPLSFLFLCISYHAVMDFLHREAPDKFGRAE